MKAAVLFLVGFGSFLLLVSPLLGFVPLLFAIPMIAGGLFLGFRPGGILRKERIIDTCVNATLNWPHPEVL